MTGWPPGYPAGRDVPPPDSELTDCEVITGLVHVTATMTLPAIMVSMNPVPFITGAFGQQIDIVFDHLRQVGLTALPTMTDAANHDLPDWKVIMGRAGQRPGTVLDERGELFVNNVIGFPMWETLVGERGNRVAVYYTPGVPLLTAAGEPAGDARALARIERLAGHGKLLGAMVPVTWRRT